jgi:general secretion pathway protein I
MDHGFTIIEALIALALVSGALTAIGSMFATTTLGVRSLEQHMSLVQMARTAVSEVPLNNSLSPRQPTGEREGFRWRIDASSFSTEGLQTPESNWVPIKLNVEVRSRAGMIFNVETIRLRRRQ